MQFSHFFIRRPIFAGVIAIIITIVGAFAYVGLPVSQFPDIVPPTVTVSTAYPGASAETVADTVAAPIEQQINGVDNMLYQSSQSTGDGRVTITVTFKLGTDLDTAQVLVQNRVALAEPSLPEEVRRHGEVVSALRSQNVQVAAGVVGQPPYDTGAAQQLNVETQGRFKTADEFANIVIRTDPTTDAITRGITQRPGTNALAAAEGVKAELADAAKSFPAGLEYRIIWNPTEFISESMTAVQETLLEAMLLVVLVIIVFLQSWRAAIIPIVAIPVSLIGTFAVLAAP